MKKGWLLLCLFIFGCEDYNDCGQSGFSNQLFIDYYDYSTNGIRSNVRFDSIFVSIADMPETLLEVDTVLYYLPVDATDTVSTYRFTTDSADYIFEFWYNQEAIVENPECGPVFRIKGLDYNTESLTFDSAAFQVLELTQLLGPHVEVYF